MKILFVASEAAPFLKTGGLGDVLEALPTALAEHEECEVALMLPLYKKIKDRDDLGLSFLTAFRMFSPLSESYVGIYAAKRGKINCYFVDNEYYFYRDGTPYGHGDDGERFVFFSHAVLESFAHIGYFPDLLHLHDWQCAAVPAFLQAFYGHIPVYRHIRTVFTVHNIEYQGRLPSGFAKERMALPAHLQEALHWDGGVNLMKGGIVLSDRVTTVSRTYAEEIRHPYFSHGLDPVLKEYAGKLSGIVNGINTRLYDPLSDPALPQNFSAEDPSGKAICKAALQKELGLPVREDVPLIAIISRLVPHKGLELIAFVLSELLSRKMQLVVLGTGDGIFEQLFRFAEDQHPDKVAARILFDGALACRIYAGCDLFLMPSKSEPCGLSQLIAMRYGAIPIVRETGGLADTVPALDPETLSGRGFTFKSFNAHDMLNAIDRAIAFFGDKEKLLRHRRALLRYDSGWTASAEEYLSVYKSLCDEPNTPKKKEDNDGTHEKTNP